MKLINDVKLGFTDILILPQTSTLSSRSEVSLEQTINFSKGNFTWTGVPIIASNMDTVGTFSAAKVLSKFKINTAIHKFYSLESWIKFCTQEASDEHNIYDYLTFTTGITSNDEERLHQVLQALPDIKFICIDVANGYTDTFLHFVEKISNKYYDKIIIAGNVVTPNITEKLFDIGVDMVKVGIGSGSVCTTRIKTGVGYPQVSAIMECAEVARNLGKFIISDGGCVNPGDVSKALCSGANFVMLGGMLAGHIESEGEVIEKNGEKYVDFYGMSSSDAMNKYFGSVAKYRSSEGKKVSLKLRGNIENTVLDIMGGIRSTCTYINASSVEEMYNKATFIKVREQENKIFNSY